MIFIAITAFLTLVTWFLTSEKWLRSMADVRGEPFYPNCNSSRSELIAYGYFCKTVAITALACSIYLSLDRTLARSPRCFGLAIFICIVAFAFWGKYKRRRI